MRHVSTRLVLAAGVLGVIVGGGARVVAQKAADNPHLGSWVMNAAKSKADPGHANQTNSVKVEAVGAGAKHTVDTVAADGTKRHWEFTTNYDGKDAPITGNSPYGSSVAVTRKGNTTHAVYKQDGKTTATLSTGAGTYRTPSASAHEAQ